METLDDEVANRFEYWWENEGSKNKPSDIDWETFIYSQTRAAWINGSWVAQTEMIKRKINGCDI